MREMSAAHALDIVGRIQAEGVDLWVDGGWGIDALLGVQHRSHDDLDLVVQLSQLNAVVAAVQGIGFHITHDARPTRLVLTNPGELQLDLHLITFDTKGDGWQSGGAPGGGDCRYPAKDFVEGLIAGRRVPCVGPDAQIDHHRGYAPRLHDIEDMGRLIAWYRSSPDLGGGQRGDLFVADLERLEAELATAQSGSAPLAAQQRHPDDD